MKTFMAGVLVGMLVAGGAGFAIGGMQARTVDDWRHIHAWGSWSICRTEDGQVVSTKLCRSCGRVCLLRM